MLYRRLDDRAPLEAAAQRGEVERDRRVAGARPHASRVVLARGRGDEGQQERQAYAAQAAADAGPPDPDGWTRVRLPIESVEQAALALLGLGPEAEVLAPRALRDAVRALARSIAARQGGRRRQSGRRRNETTK